MAYGRQGLSPRLTVGRSAAREASEREGAECAATPCSTFGLCFAAAISSIHLPILEWLPWFPLNFSVCLAQARESAVLSVASE
jgi:hypothetical protein